MKLTTKGRYTLQALLDLSHRSTEKAVKLKDISERQQIPLHYLEKLFNRLKQQGIVKTVKGPGGGQLLARNPTIAEVLFAVGEIMDYSDDLNKDGTADTVERGSLKTYIVEFDTVIKTFLNKTLKELESEGE